MAKINLQYSMKKITIIIFWGLMATVSFGQQSIKKKSNKLSTKTNHKLRIYQVMIHLWGNTTQTNKINGTLEDLDASLYEELLPKIDYSVYQDKPVILKGCSKKPVPTRAYVVAVQHLQQVARSIMYGEACSAVPLFKTGKKE